MTALTITLPDFLHSQLCELADREGILIDQLAASALSEKVAALMNTDYLVQRAQRGNRSKFDQALTRVKALEPEQQDTL